MKSNMFQPCGLGCMSDAGGVLYGKAILYVYQGIRKPWRTVDFIQKS